MKSNVRQCVHALLTLSVLFFSAGSLSQISTSNSPAYQRAANSRSAEDSNLVWTASSVALLSQEIAPGVYTFYPDTSIQKTSEGIPEATSGGFVVGENGVLVIDTMLNRRLATQVISLIQETTEKPIRYIVNTSYHGDHSYGNQFFPSDAQIIQHRATRDYIRDNFEEDISFMESNFGTNQGLDELEPVSADILLQDGVDMSVDLGGIEVRIRHLGFAQTEGDLFVTTGNVVFTGNPVIARAPALPWLLDGHLQESVATMKALRDMLSDDAIVVPGHGEPTNVAAIEYHIDYLEDLESRVLRAISERKSLEATVEAVSMPEYSGYALHPWVHMQVNVPAAYEELSK